MKIINSYKMYIIISILLITFTQLHIFAENKFLLGNEEGLFVIENFKKHNIWNEAQIIKIAKAGNQWLFLTDKGLASTKNLSTFYYLNSGLPKKIIKHIDQFGNKTFIEKIQPLKDLEVHPFNPNIFVTATSDNVYLTQDAGVTWTNLGSNGWANGIKAVSVLDVPAPKGGKVLTVFVSHALYGIAWKQPSVNINVWNDLNAGLKKGPEGIEEVADIVFDQHSFSPIIYCVQTFTGIIYKLDWTKKLFIPIISQDKAETSLTCTDSLHIIGNTVFGIMQNELFETNLLMPKFHIYTNKNLFKNYENIKNFLKGNNFLCAYIPQKLTPFKADVVLSELWLLRKEEYLNNEYLKKAHGKKGLYIPTHQAANIKTFQNHIKTLKKNKLNAIVVDMKDESGFVRYQSLNPDILKYNGVRYTLDIEKLVKKARDENIYLIGRIVAFKDKNLYYYNNGEYAVKDKFTKKPWQGYTIDNGEKQIIQEHWVDPYNENVWKYNVDIAKELCDRGFDEIQFDYIRFPTDGLNLSYISYPACESGMDKVSALMSFLSYARQRIKAPISIDIYGSNGWYRTGARTGQEVELIAEYVDIICPMFYPSHFAQTFLAYKPAEDRPYRIYYQGSYRNKLIARNKVIIRPWTQAFFIPVSYDKKYYDKDYVKRQILGIKDSINEGYIYWNNSGRYLDIRPDGEPL